MRQHISWITADYFLDTDVYVLEELVKHYDLDWYIIHQENNAYEYTDRIKVIKNSSNVHYIEISRHASDPRNLNAFLKLIKKIKRGKSKLVYTCLSFAPYLLPLLSIGFSKDKIILGIHNVHVPSGGTHYTMNKLYNRFAIKTFKHFQTFSKSQYDLLSAEVQGKEKEVKEIPFMLKDYGKATIQRVDERLTFLSFGNIRDYKCIDVLIKAAQAAYEETNIRFKVIIAGACSDWDKYQELIKYPELFDLRIHRVEDAEIPNLFVQADYFVVPYKDIAQSGSTIVAINYDVPVIASRFPAFEEFVIDNQTGFLIKPADEQELKETIIRLLRAKPDEHKRLKGNVHELRSNTFSSEAIIGSYRRYIDDIITGQEKTMSC